MARKLRIRPETPVFHVDVDTFEGWRALDDAFSGFAEGDEEGSVRRVSVLRRTKKTDEVDVMVWIDLGVRKTRTNERVIMFTTDDAMYLVACDPELTPREVMDTLSTL